MRMTITFRLRFAGNGEPKDCLNAPGAMSSSFGTRANEGTFEANTRLRAIEAFP
jgi:hypothetical protein